MKHLLRFDEKLNKSTYVSAASKLRALGGQHEIRSSRLRAHARKHGEGDVDIHNLHYHEFTIDNELYTITNCEVEAETDLMFFAIYVDLINELGDMKTISIIFDSKCEIYLNEYGTEYLEENQPEFLFHKRKDAVEFKKFVLEWLKNDNIENYLEIFRKIPINSLYK